jgi:P4 family phage/plasmid primase-like protien
VTTLLDAALELLEAGLCVLPAAGDGSKRPAVDWKAYQTERPTTGHLKHWLAQGYEGIGIVAGAVSGNLEMTELEGRAVAAGALGRLHALAAEAGEAELLGRLLKGYVVASPTQGMHVVYRVDGMTVPGNTKLAATADHVTLAETRGEGGWMVTAPSAGRVHPTRRPWALVAGGPSSIPTITADERDRFHALVRMLDERPVAAPSAPNPFAPLSRAGSTDGISPGDDYNDRTSWDEVLTEDGWRRAFTRGEVTMWTRPGKTHGISATTGHMGDWLYPFTSSTVLEPERTYTRFGYRAAWSYGGDHQACAEALQRLGFGKRATVVALPVSGTGSGTALAATGTDGAPAPVAQVSPLVQAFGLNDVGNAKLFVAAHGHRLRFCPERGSWLRWEGHRWVTDEAGVHVELVKDVLEDAARTAVDKTAVTHFQRSLSWRGVQAVVGLARTDQTVMAPIEMLDAIPDALCTPGGIVDLRSGAVRPADPLELHTRSTPCAPTAMDGDTIWMPAQTPRWVKFLDDTFGGDAEMIGYVQRLAGYSATGDVSAHILPFLYGPSGQNGKSVLMEVIGTLLGSYADVAPGAFLTVGPAQHETEIARLQGVRFVACSETEPGARFAEAKVKGLTGGDRIRARFMRRDHFAFDPTAKLWLMANDRPAVGSGGTSFWRRLRLLEFRHKVSEDQRIDGLGKILVREEGPGILAWIVAGAVAYYSGGLRTPAGVKASTAEYASAEDDLGRFIAERLIVAAPEARAHIRSLSAEVTGAYHRWCAEEGVEPVSNKAFGMALRTRCGIEPLRSNGRRFYLGVTVAADEGASTFTALTTNPINY